MRHIRRKNINKSFKYRRRFEATTRKKRMQNRKIRFYNYKTRIWFINKFPPIKIPRIGPILKRRRNEKRKRLYKRRKEVFGQYFALLRFKEVFDVNGRLFIIM